MKANMGQTDKTIRVILAGILGVLFLTNIVTGTLGYIFIALAVVFVLTSVVSFCPLYLPFGINTCAKKA
jgi:hypothetical protein